MSLRGRLAILAALFLFGCGGPTVGHWAHQTDSKISFDQSLQTWTRQAEAYEHFEGRVFAHAIYLSPAMAWAVALERADRYRAPDDTSLIQGAAAVEHATRTARFLVSLVTVDPYWNDLAHSEPTFQVSLTTEGQVQTPARIIQISENELADLRPLFPFITGQSTAYWIDFPGPRETRHVHLRLAGTPATLDLQWETR